MEKYFVNCNTPAAVKSMFRKLAFMHHPDRGGDTRTMQIINDQYYKALERLNGQSFVGTDNKERVYYYNYTTEKMVIEKMFECLALKMKGVDIEIIGTWLWVSGNTKPYSSKLKWNNGEGLGLRWNHNRQAWQWHRPTKKRTRYAKDMSVDDLRDMYGHYLPEKNQGNLKRVA